METHPELVRRVLSELEHVRAKAFMAANTGTAEDRAHGALLSTEESALELDPSRHPLLAIEQLRIRLRRARVSADDTVDREEWGAIEAIVSCLDADLAMDRELIAKMLLIAEARREAILTGNAKCERTTAGRLVAKPGTLDPERAEEIAQIEEAIEEASGYLNEAL